MQTPPYAQAPEQAVLERPSSQDGRPPISQPSGMVQSVPEGIMLLCASTCTCPKELPRDSPFGSRAAVIQSLARTHSFFERPEEDKVPPFRHKWLSFLLRMLILQYVLLIALLWTIDEEWGPLFIFFFFILAMLSLVLGICFGDILRRRKIIRARDAFISFSAKIFYVFDDSTNVSHAVPVSSLVCFDLSTTHKLWKSRTAAHYSIVPGRSKYSIEAVTMSNVILLGTFRDEANADVLVKELNRLLQRARTRGTIEPLAFELFPTNGNKHTAHRYCLESNWCLSNPIETESHREKELEFRSIPGEGLEMKFCLPSRARTAQWLFCIWSFLSEVLVFVWIFLNIWPLMITIMSSISILLCLCLEAKTILWKTVRFVDGNAFNTFGARLRLCFSRKRRLCVQDVCGVDLHRKLSNPLWTSNGEEDVESEGFQTSLLGGSRYQIVLNLKSQTSLCLDALSARQAITTAAELKRHFPTMFSSTSGTV